MSTEAEARDLRLRKVELAIIAAIVYVAAILILILPAYALAGGIQAAGDAAGLWAGDPNSNDGEEVWATALGVALVTIVLAAAAVALLAAGRKYSVTAMPSIVTGTLIVLVLVAVVCVGVVTAVPETALGIH